MRTTILAFVVAAIMVVAVPQAFAATYKPYVSVFGGGSWIPYEPNIYSEFGSRLGRFDTLAINNPSRIIGGTVGVDWGNNWRTEFELSFANFESDHFHITEFKCEKPPSSLCVTHRVPGDAGSTVSTTYLLGNIWYDIGSGSKLTPYIGGGLGMGLVGADMFRDTLNAEQVNSAGLAIQLGLGLRFNVSEHVLIDAGYRFKDIVWLPTAPGDLSLSRPDTNFGSHNFQMGLTYRF